MDNTFATLHRNVALGGKFILSEPKFTEFKNVQNKAEDEFTKLHELSEPKFDQNLRMKPEMYSYTLIIHGTILKIL